MISQRTVGCLQTLLDWLFRDRRGLQSLWSWSDLRLALYKEGLDREWLDYIYEETHGRPFRFLPSIHDGTIPACLTRNTGYGQPIPKNEDKALGQAIIALIIQVTAERANRYDEGQMSEVLASLKLDGYELVGGKVTSTAVPGVDLQREEDFLLSQIQRIGLHNFKDIRHHFDEAVKTFVNGNWGSSSTENRNFFIALLRGMRELASTTGGVPVFNQPGKDGPLIHDFHMIGMLTIEEKEAVLNIWILLSHSGPHVGIKEEDSALLSRFLVLGMTRWVCLKFEDWAAKGFKRP